MLVIQCIYESRSLEETFVILRAHYYSRFPITSNKLNIPSFINILLKLYYKKPIYTLFGIILEIITLNNCLICKCKCKYNIIVDFRIFSPLCNILYFVSFSQDCFYFMHADTILYTFSNPFVYLTFSFQCLPIPHIMRKGR